MLGPVLRGLNHLANAIVRLLGQEPKDEVASAFTREEVAGLISESSDEGLLDTEEHGWHHRRAAVRHGRGRPPSWCPTSRSSPCRTGPPRPRLERACARTGFSRFPVQAPDGRYLGYLHIRDVVDVPVADRDRPVPANGSGCCRRLPAGDRLRSALDRMRRAGAHLGQVVAPAGSGRR